MPRANRYYLPGYVWHITHRCHEREHLLKFPRDRRCWVDWLFEARKRYGLTVLNYMVTCNHIHLLVAVDDDPLAIPRSMQLIAGRSGQQFNQRKHRAGAFWEDRYHATAVESEHHLLRCLVYIDLNMVRAGVFSHPSECPFGGYGEIQVPRRKSVLIAHQKLASLAGFATYDAFRHTQRVG